MTLLDSYSETNYSSDEYFWYGTSAIGQVFTGAAGTCDSVKFYLKKSGSPTGNIVAKLYAITGTFGSSAKPTGTALATSDTIDVMTLTTSYQLITFTFSSPYTMSADYYAISVEFPSNNNDYVMVGEDSTSPTHSGNKFYFNSAWYAVSNYDECFYVYYTPQLISPTFTSINIGDVWKTISGSSVLQINIGDIWKVVSGVQINIGDVWKNVTLY